MRGPIAPLLALALLAGGCQTAYYSAMERFGVEKRDILVDRVEETRDAQQKAEKQFGSALDEFMAVTDYDGGELEARYDRLKSAYQASESRAEAVRERIDSVEQVSEDLFAEWEAELDTYGNERLREQSAEQLASTQSRYRELIRTMHDAEERMPPVLKAFSDRVLFLKHNLNARAVGQLRDDATEVRADVEELLARMRRSINDADAFIKAMGPPAGQDG